MNTDFTNICEKDTSELELAGTYVPSIPNDIIFPDELNTYLRDQIQCLTHENGMLKKNLTETEAALQNETSQVQTLTKQLKQYEEVSASNNFLSVSAVASSKIVELSKKVREKSSELESLRTKYTKVEQQLSLFQRKEEEKCSEVEKEDSVSKIDNLNNMEDEIKQLHEKVNNVTIKLFETRNANMQLRNDLKLANKLLQQEIGDTFENLQTIVNNGNNWRGRAQIICDLQQKNNELKEKLKLYQEKSSYPTLGSKQSDSKLSENMNSKYDRRIDILSKENLTLKNDIHELKKKVDIVRARSKALESENSVIKTRATLLSEQQENDRELIATLTSQLATIKNVQSEDIKHKDQMLTKLQRECKQLYTQLSKEQCKFEHMRLEYEGKLSSEVENRDYGDNTRPQSQKSMATTIDDKILARLETERVRLLELAELANKRLEDERKIVTELQLQYKTERQKNARLEAKVARIELESCGRQSTYSLLSSKSKEDEALRDKLELAEESIKALKTRLEMEQKERQLDFQEFSQILKNYTPSSSQHLL
ncbi:hypothetical protein Trydic_g4406 [Trypoxylus dichotomus]